jgi:maleylpyruvate isomerase
LQITRAELVEGIQASTAALLAGLDDGSWSDASVREPSRLPAWSRGHVLTHLARNADGIATTVEGALRGEEIPRYPFGMAGRDADIEAGSGRPFVTLREDVQTSAAALATQWERCLGMNEIVWDWTADGRPISAWLNARWREVEFHRVDLGTGYSPAQWPAGLVASELPGMARNLAQRSGVPALRIEVTAAGSVCPDLVGSRWSLGDTAGATAVDGPDWAVLAWMIGRTEPGSLSAAPELPPWL